jgi:predicted dehydrogenase
MSINENSGMSRREVLKSASKVAAASALAGVTLPHVHASQDSTIQVALVGSGGRGTGAAVNALSSPSTNGPVRLVSMADVSQQRLNSSYTSINRSRPQQVAVPQERRYIGFDAYRHAMDALRPGDIVILATPPAFRWVHFTYAIEKRLNVFMEKPVTVDGPSTRRMFDLATRSEQAGLKVGVGLMCRHCVARGQLFDRIQNGEIGDLTLLRCYRMKGPEATCFSTAKPAGISELMFQIQRFHSFLWLSGGCYSDFLIHNIDECCWMKNAFPISARGSGGRHYKVDDQNRPYIDQNFDSYSVEYTFADGAKMLLEGRTMPGCSQEFASFCHGTRGCAVISQNSHSPTNARTFRGQNFNNNDLIWRFSTNPRRDEPDPYQLEWDHLLAAIRNNRPYNEVRRGAEASLVTSMGRMSAHTGQVVTRDQILNSDHEFAPTVDQLTLDGPAPLVLGANGRYPTPQPGTGTGAVRREYYV